VSIHRECESCRARKSDSSEWPSKIVHAILCVVSEVMEAQYSVLVAGNEGVTRFFSLFSSLSLFPRGLLDLVPYTSQGSRREQVQTVSVQRTQKPLETTLSYLRKQTMSLLLLIPHHRL